MLEVWSPSPRIIEPCIALSIAYVGIENWFARDAKRRWRITLPFGLVHGFGFAGALHEIGLARGEVPKALLAFNLGVETGQLAMLAVFLPIVLLLRRLESWPRVGMRASAAIVTLIGVACFIDRVLQVT